MRWVQLLLVLVLCLWPTQVSLAAEPEVKIEQLIASPHEWDGKTVTIRGEAIGDVMIRGTDGWVNLLDGTALGVFAPKELLQQIKWLGSNAQQGDWVVVTGVFHDVCPEHQGETDLHAVSLRVEKPGQKTIRPIDRQKLIMALILVPITTGVVLYARRPKERR